MTRQPLAWAKHYAFEAVALVGVVLTQIEIWATVEENQTRLAAIALVTSGALLFRRRAPFVAPLVVAAGAVVLTLVDPSAAYSTDTMVVPILLSAWAAGWLDDRRLAVTALAAILAAGWTVFIRAPGVQWTELIWLTFTLIGVFLISTAAARHSERARLAEEWARRTKEEARRAVEDERTGSARAARRGRALGQRDGGPGERRPPAADARPAAEREALMTSRRPGDGAFGDAAVDRVMRTEAEVAEHSRRSRDWDLPGLVEQVRQPGCRWS